MGFMMGLLSTSMAIALRPLKWHHLLPPFSDSKIPHSSSSSPFSSPFSSLSSGPRSSPESCNFSGANSILRKKGFKLHVMSTTVGDASPQGIINGEMAPDHLLVLVHGILASTNDWTYFDVELKRQLGRNFLIYGWNPLSYESGLSQILQHFMLNANFSHDTLLSSFLLLPAPAASSANTYTKTLSGIDGAGRRLAEEVKQVVKRTESLKKISFLSHSLGGLFARYAVAVLYTGKTSGEDKPDGNSSEPDHLAQHGEIAGLEPISFVTLATPHLGVRGRKQLPFLFGVQFLEKLAAPIAPIFVGRTGKQLFLTDGKSNRPPLLLRMASDCEDGKFISALGAFRCRILYANISYDHMVGWRTSSIRRENELSKPKRRSLKGYKHVVDVEWCPPASCEGPHFPPEAAKAKEAAQTEPTTENTGEYHEIMEEEMIRGLQRLGWIKVDVSFHSAMWPFFAHNNIHVKNEWFHNAGTGVVAHVVDTLKHQEQSATHLSANL